MRPMDELERALHEVYDPGPDRPPEEPTDWAWKQFAFWGPIALVGSLIAWVLG